MTPVVVGAAINGPPPPAPSIYRKAIFFPSRDQRGRAAYPVKFVSFLGSEPSALIAQSCFWSFSLAAENIARILESGDQAGSESVRSAVVPILTIVADAVPSVPR